MRTQFRPAAQPVDPALFFAWGGLALLGWLLVYSVSHDRSDLSALPWRQAVFLLAGGWIQWRARRTTPEWWLDRSFWFYLVTLVALALVPVLGITVNGARRWLSLGPLGALQPSEFAKWSCLLWQVRLLSMRRWLLACLAPLPAILLCLKQPDLGTAACFAASTWALLFLAGANLRWLLPLSAVGGYVTSLGLHDYQRERLLMFLDPEKDAAGAGWNLIQAKIAVGSGGIAGLGLLQGLQKKLMFVPEQQTDFIFTVLAEECGLIGAGLLLLLYALLFYRSLELARRAQFQSQSQSQANGWLCGAATAALAFQALVNLGMVIGLCPVTGIPLPFLSYGGSAVLTQSLLLAMLQAESAQQQRRARLQPRARFVPRG